MDCSTSAVQFDLIQGKIYGKYLKTIPAETVQEKSVEELMILVREQMAKGIVKIEDSKIIGQGDGCWVELGCFVLFNILLAWKLFL